MEAQLEAWADDAETVDIVMDLFNRGLVTINPIKGFNDLSTAVNTMFGEITSGTSTPQTAIETYQSQIDTALSDISNYDYDAEMEAYLNPTVAPTEAPAAE